MTGRRQINRDLPRGLKSRVLGTATLKFWGSSKRIWGSILFLKCDSDWSWVAVYPDYVSCWTIINNYNCSLFRFLYKCVENQLNKAMVCVKNVLWLYFIKHQRYRENNTELVVYFMRPSGRRVDFWESPGQVFGGNIRRILRLVNPCFSFEN